MSVFERVTTLYAQDRWAALLGVEPFDWGRNTLTVTLPFRAGNLNMGGRIPGGKIATVLVDAQRLLTLAQAGDPEQPVTITDFQISYLKGGGRETLTAHAEVSRRTREFVFTRGVLNNEAGTAIATASAVFRLANGDAATHHHQPGIAAWCSLGAGESSFQGIIDLFNRAMQQHHPACGVTAMATGYCRMRQDPIDEQRDFAGCIAPGQLLTFFDNVGGGAGSSLATEFGMAVTLSIQASFCEPVDAGQPIVGEAVSFRRQAGLTNNQVRIWGVDDARLKVFGNMTHLVRSPKQRGSGAT